MDRTAECRPPPDPQRHPVGAQQRCAVARPAATLRPGGDGVEPVLSLAPVGCVAPRAGRVAGPGRRRGRVCWELHLLDSTVVRAHQHAAGARKAGREPGTGDEALGRSRGGFTTKIHVRCEGYGKPVTFTLTGGQVHDSQQVTALINRGAIRRIGRGRPRLRPAKLAGDKAYSSRSIRLALRKRGITPVIPTKANERRQPDFDREAYRQRNIVERLINRLKNFRRIATRYEKRAANYLAMITIGAILLWI